VNPARYWLAGWRHAIAWAVLLSLVAHWSTFGVGLMRVLVVQNYDNEGMGQVGAALAEVGAEIDLCKP
jgi:hypothetical protein